jgi:hypothetical protein
MSLKKNNLLIFIILLLNSFFSFFLVKNYVGGDQAEYRKFYEIISTLDYSETYVSASAYLNSNEPVSVFLLWLGSINKIDKDLYVSLLNSLLLLFYLKAIARYIENIYALIIYSIFTVFSFYFIVLETGAERLKIGFLFLFLSGILKSRLKYVFVFLSIMSHFQMLIFYISYFLYGQFKFILKKIDIKEIQTFVVRGVISVLIFALFWNYFGVFLIEKGAKYEGLERFNFKTYLPLSILLLFNMIIYKNILYSLLIIAPYYIFQFFIAHDRVNILAFSTFLYFAISNKKAFHPLVVVLNIYFMFKSYGFILNIINNGGGFSQSWGD